MHTSAIVAVNNRFSTLVLRCIPSHGMINISARETLFHAQPRRGPIPPWGPLPPRFLCVVGPAGGVTMQHTLSLFCRSILAAYRQKTGRDQASKVSGQWHGWIARWRWQG